jgi:hypothetical protein
MGTGGFGRLFSFGELGYRQFGVDAGRFTACDAGSSPNTKQCETASRV